MKQAQVFGPFTLLQIDSATDFIVEHAVGRSVIAFYGEPGAGKTTLIRQLCHKMGIVGNISSPTFSLINEYTDPVGNPIYHVDLYRIGSIDEALRIGIIDYIRSGHQVWVEWPDFIKKYLPENVLCLHLTGSADCKYLTVE